MTYILRPRIMPKSSTASPTAFARLEDPATGIVEEAGFADVNGDRLFTVRHLPPDAAVAGLVMCCPIFAEFEKNYRREVPLARSLASAGIAVQRFHYRGTGHSDDAAMTFDTMRQDALVAARSLLERTNVTGIGVMGTRLGGLVAAGAAGEFPGAPLALWDPVVAPDRYFREVIRYRRVLEMRQGRETDAGDFREELRRNGAAEVVGYQLRRELYESMVARNLLRELGPVARAVLLVQFGQPQRPLRAEYRQLRDELTGVGLEIDTAIAPLDEAWLFATQWQPPERLLTLTAEWLRRRLVPARASG